jgi:hypothetical protein
MGSNKKPGTSITARTVVATFCPTRLDDVRPEGWAHIGWRGLWQALWTVDDSDSPYFGQTIWWPLDGAPWFGWVPDEDLFDREEAGAPGSAP